MHDTIKHWYSPERGVAMNGFLLKRFFLSKFLDSSLTSGQFPTISSTAVKFPEISRFCRQVVTGHSNKHMQTCQQQHKISAVLTSTSARRHATQSSISITPASVSQPVDAQTTGSCGSVASQPVEAQTTGSCGCVASQPVEAQTTGSCGSVASQPVEAQTSGSCGSVVSQPLYAPTRGSCRSTVQSSQPGSQWRQSTPNQKVETIFLAQTPQ